MFSRLDVYLLHLSIGQVASRDDVPRLDGNFHANTLFRRDERRTFSKPYYFAGIQAAPENRRASIRDFISLLQEL